MRSIGALVPKRWDISYFEENVLLCIFNSGNELEKLPELSAIEKFIG